MATKKPTAISKHKTATARKTVKPAQPQAFDIIPKSKVRPSATSRPVITSSTPAVADNTLTASSGVPTLQVKRRNIIINPSDDTDLSKEDVMPNLAPAVTTSPPEAAPSDQPALTVASESSVTPPATQGVAVSELIAKRSETGGDGPVAVANTAAEVPATELESAPAAQPTATTDASPGTTPELPAAEQAHVDDQAAAEAARLLSDEPEPVPPPGEEAMSATGAEAEQAVEAMSIPAPTTASPSEPVENLTASNDTTQSTSVPVTSTAELQPPAELEAAVKHEEAVTDMPVPATPEKTEPVANDVLQEVLKEEPVEPQAHSQALKDAMKDMEGKGGADKSDRSQHHELYGGKPVIVVHKEHGAMSATAWVLWFFLCLGLAVLIVNFLLDAGFIETTYRIPHTNIL